MSLYVNANVSSTLSNYGMLGNTGRVGQNAVYTPQVAQLVQSYFAQGAPLSFANALANLPAAPLPRPPFHNASLQQAEAALAQFLGQIGGFARRGKMGYQAFLGMQAMSNTLGKYNATQDLYSQTTFKATFVNEFPTGRTPVGTTPTAGKRETKDEFGTGLGAGKGHTSNLSNSPEVVLAINSLLSKGKNIKMDKLQQQLKDKFGIESELTKINGRKALKFANGDHIVDANGNGAIDKKDYKFKGAVASIKEKYGLTDDQIKNFGAQPPKAAVGQAASQFQTPATGLAQWYNRPYNFPQMQNVNQLFAMAMFYAQ